jgi:hypothetical protein
MVVPERGEPTTKIGFTGVNGVHSEASASGGKFSAICNLGLFD